MDICFEFEKPIVTLEKKLQDLKELSKQDGVDLTAEIRILEKKVEKLIDEVFGKLTSWEKVQLSRHPNRPYTNDYIENLFPDFFELHGDRHFGDDPAMVTGVATWFTDSQPIIIIGQQKGRTTKQKMHRNFGMAKPEGYRKVMRIIEMAERFRIPILTFIDTPGAYPGIETEERGQAQAIAECIRAMFDLTVPVVAVVIGEGGSGGALAIGIANKVLMQEYSTYSVISPEGCASILWNDSKMAERASECLKMNPPDLKSLGVIDDIISEPKGGAHRNWPEAFALMKESLVKHLDPLLKRKWKEKGSQGPSASAAKGGKKTSKKKSSSKQDLREERIEKFRWMGESAIGHASRSTSS